LADMRFARVAASIENPLVGTLASAKKCLQQ
jgi:hypothetical protein